MPAEANGNGAKMSASSDKQMGEGVGDCMAYRKRTGRFTIVEWLGAIVLPVLIILLGAFLSNISCVPG